MALKIIRDKGDLNIMAILKDLIVNGVSRFIGKIYASGGIVGDLEGTATNASKVNGHTVNVDVPSDAKFTDTWRGIQNNLTSDSTTDSLSANQGKTLKELMDTHIHDDRYYTKVNIDNKLDNKVYTDQNQSLKSMIDNYVCPNSLLNGTKYFVVQSSDGWFKVSCNNHNNNRFTGICIYMTTSPNPPIYAFVSFGNSTTTLTRINSIQSSGYLEATKNITLKSTTWTEGASVTLPTASLKYNVQITVVHANNNPMVERDIVGVNGISLNSFEVLEAGNAAVIGATLVGQYSGGTKMYASHYLDNSDASRAITSSIYVTYQAIA